jgi:uncharacterized protein YecT (DUF1311 family)
MRIIALAIMLMLDTAGAVAVAADAIPYPVSDCGQLTVQMEINACAGANLEAADVALNKVYRQVMGQQSDTALRDQLRDVERAWIAHRDRECALLVGPRESGGSIWPMEMSNCLEEKTATRIRELTKLRGCTTGVSACNPH